MPKILRAQKSTAPVDQNTKGGLAPEAEVPVKEAEVPLRFAKLFAEFSPECTKFFAEVSPEFTFFFA